MRVPKYRKHSSGQAAVRLNGKDHYLGKYDTPASREKYRRLVAHYVREHGAAAEPGAVPHPVGRAIDRFLFGPVEAMEYRQRHHFRTALEEVRALCPDLPLPEFGPVKFKAVRQRFVARGWCRRHVTAMSRRVAWWLRWCAGEEIYPGDKLAAVLSVPTLRQGEAPDHPKVRPVADAVADATLPHLPPYARALVEVLRWSGCRPKEAVMMRPEDVDTSGKAVLPGGRVIDLAGCWVYKPATHKTEGLGIDKWIVLGPRAVEALAPLLRFTPAGGYVFAPARSGRAVAPVPHYRVRSLHKAIEVGCKRAGVPHWFPYQLRHLAATRIKAELGEEHAKDALGHTALDTTSIYAQRSLERAAEAMRKAG